MKVKFPQFLVKIIRYIFDTIGGVLLSKQSFDNLNAQRDCAVRELVAMDGADLKEGVEGFIFSKDRALQLYSLLVSYHGLVSNPAPLSVIYTASTDEHLSAYKEVEMLVSQLHLNVKFIREVGGFKKTLVEALNLIQVRNLFFLVDDIVFIRNVDFCFARTLDTTRYILSLRHSPNLSRSYTANKRQKPPRLTEYGDALGVYGFIWFEQGCEWSDPWSVDGQILSTAEVRVITKISNFLAPNSYEAALKSFNTLCSQRRGLCYFESKILNLPMNRVQNECDNLSGSVSPDYLLEQWNKGMMLDTVRLLTHTPVSPHEEHPVAFKIRPAS